MAMLPLAHFLKKQGYVPINVGYFGPKGLRHSLKSVCERLDERLAPYVDTPVHFVTHSMGGIVARGYLSQRFREAGGRLVQLAPPNQGAFLANEVSRFPLLDKVPAFFDLGKDTDGNPRHGIPRLEGYEVGVIAGRSFGPWHRGVPSDGVVRVVETQLAEARDWILLQHFHTVVMSARDTWKNVDLFLREGRFTDEATRLELDEQGRVCSRSSGSETPTLLEAS
jgi:triacylglycerol lipase